MNDKKLKFSIEDIVMDDSGQTLDEMQFAKARIKGFASGMTKHRYLFSEDSLKTGSETFAKKPILWKYNIFRDDANEHDSDEVPCGFIPENPHIEFKYEDDGRLFVYFDAYIWKLYCGNLIEIFKRTDAKKDVSVELLSLDDTDHPDENYTEVHKFCITGVTILGEHVSPAVDSASIELIKFSEIQNSFDVAKDKFEKTYLIKELDCSSNTSDSFFNTKNPENKEEHMVTEIKNSVDPTPEKIDNAEQVVRTSTKIVVDKDKYDDNGMFIGNEYEEHKKDTTVVEEIPDSNSTVTNASTEPSTSIDNSAGATTTDEKEVTNACTTQDNSVSEAEKVKCAELEVKCAELETQLSKLQGDYSALSVKCAELETYKTNKESEALKQSIECALHDVSNILSASQIDEWREKSVTCSNIADFTNQLKAFAFDIQQKNGVSVEPSLRNSIPTEQQFDSDDVWARLEHKFNK